MILITFYSKRRASDLQRSCKDIKESYDMYIIYGETDHQSRLDAWDKRSDLVHWEDLEGSGVQSLKHILIF